MSQQQNWNRIRAELQKAISESDGPIEGKSWSELGDDTKEVFTAQIITILEAELSNRAGEETRVNVKIRTALEAIGEQLTRDKGAEGPDV